MNLFENFTLWGSGWAGWFFPFLVALTIVVFVHELGHFLVARWCGIKVLVFSVGFGPELFGFTDRRGTRWKVSAIPLGGYVKFFGDENAASVPDQNAIASMNERDRRVSFFHKPVGQRAAVVAAGPIANFILAIVVFAVMGMAYGEFVIPARVDAIEEGSAAASAGFEVGDKIVEIDGKPISNFDDLRKIVEVSAGRELAFVVERNGQRVTVKVTPTLKEIKDNFGNIRRVGMLGIKAQPRPEDVTTHKMGALEATKYGFAQTWEVIDRTMTYLGRVIVGRESAEQLGGPIRIAQVAGQVATYGFMAVIKLAAVLSVSIGLLNLFPIPLLDGGHLLFYAIEAVRGRPLSERAQEMGFRIGLAIVLMLMIFATFNDILFLAKS